MTNSTYAEAHEAARAVFAARDDQITSRCAAGESQSSVARELGITRQRVQQIVARAALEARRSERRARNRG